MPFSRSAIPHGRDADQPPEYWGHVGVYAFRLETLRLLNEMAVAGLWPLWIGCALLVLACLALRRQS